MLKQTDDIPHDTSPMVFTQIVYIEHRDIGILTYGFPPSTCIDWNLYTEQLRLSRMPAAILNSYRETVDKYSHSVTHIKFYSKEKTK